MSTQYEIYVEDKDTRFHCGDEQRLLHAMQAQGLGSIPVGCKGGGCGICRIQITQGRYETRKMSRTHVTAEDELLGIVLSCRVTPKSDLSLRLAPNPDISSICRYWHEEKAGTRNRMIPAPNAPISG